MNLDDLIAKLSKKYEIVVGFPKDKQVVYPPDDRKGHHNPGGQTVAQVASGNEFGIPKKKVPSRPFLREALRKNKPEIVKMVSNAMQIRNLSDTSRFDKIGLKMVTMVRDSITNGDWAPNAPSTQRQKLTYGAKKQLDKGNASKAAVEFGKMRPLIDRGIMRKSVNYEIRSS